MTQVRYVQARHTYPGAERRRIGKLEQAIGGTLLIDEVGELPAEAQELIRQLQMEPHPEGGFYKETFRDTHAVGGGASNAARASF